MLIVTAAAAARRLRTPAGARARADAAGDARETARGQGAADRAVAAMTRRLDTVTAVTRVLLDNSTFSEAVTLQRCARLLAGEIADWVLIDIERDGRLLRQFAAGPRGGHADQLARMARGVDPDQESVPAAGARDRQVRAARAPRRPRRARPRPRRHAAADVARRDLADLRADLRRDDRLRLADADPAGGQGAVRRRRPRPRRGARQAPGDRDPGRPGVPPAVTGRRGAAGQPAARRLPAVPGLEFAAAYIGATQFQEISGDFYDVFKAGDGWGIAVGDVCGKGQDAAAMTAAARHAIRALAHVHEAPADVLAAANEVLVAEDYDDRFVTASLAFLRQRGRRVQVQLGSLRPSGPAVVRADGRVEILEGDGLPLGLFPDAEPGRLELELHAGRRAVLLHRRGDRGAGAPTWRSSRTGWRTRSPRSRGARPRRSCAPSRSSSPRSPPASSRTTSRSSRSGSG